MNILLQHPLPLTAAGKPVRASFRNMIKVELLFQNEQYTESEKLMYALNLLYREMPDDVGAAIDGLMWFYTCGEQHNPAGKGGAGGRAYDFEQDARLIYAAFATAYGMRLESIDFLHWWEFISLFTALPPETPMARIIGYRTADLSEMNQYEREFYQKMRQKYSLKGKPDPRQMTVAGRDAAAKEEIRRRFEEIARQKG